MSGNNELNSSCDYVDFYNMVRKWTNYDYHTPKAKAEVIVDMLISDFITDIFDAFFPEEGENAVLLAKEFPIPGYVEDAAGYYTQSAIANSPAVDFLVLKGNTLYLVELKTNSSSYNDKQLLRMIMAKEIGVKYKDEPKKNDTSGIWDEKRIKGRKCRAHCRDTGSGNGCHNFDRERMYAGITAAANPGGGGSPGEYAGSGRDN